MMDYLNRFKQLEDCYVVVMSVAGEPWKFYVEATCSPMESLRAIVRKHNPSVVTFRNVRKTENADRIVSHLRNNFWTTRDGRIKGDLGVIVETIKNWQPRKRPEAINWERIQ